MAKKNFYLRKVVAIAICLAVGATLFAQDRAIRIVKDGIDVFAYEISDSEKIVFKDPGGAATPASDDALIVKKASGETVRTLLDEIKEITLSEGLLSVVPFSGTPAFYALGNVRLLFDYGESGINSPQMPENEVNVWLNRSGEIVVESMEAIRSLTLFSVEGRMIAYEKYGDSGGLISTSFGNRVAGIPAGIYFVRVETAQKQASKKLIINH